MARRTLSQRQRLWFRPSIHREKKVVGHTIHDQSAFTVADLRNAELCVFGRKFVPCRAYPKHLAGFLVTLLHSWITN